MILADDFIAGQVLPVMCSSSFEFRLLFLNPNFFRFREIYFNYNRVLNGLNQEAPRFDTCLTRLQDWMGLSLSNLYVKNHFDKESKKQANILVKYLMEEFKRILSHTDWMDENTRKTALEKADAFATYIGYPTGNPFERKGFDEILNINFYLILAELLNDTLVSNYYKELSIDQNEYFSNVFRNYNRFITNKSYHKLREPNDKNDWKKHALAATVNAFNYLDSNSIEFPGESSGIKFAPEMTD